MGSLVFINGEDLGAKRGLSVGRSNGLLSNVVAGSHLINGVVGFPS